ncbi:MAG TPA: MBL fold metallo-hydrolase [Frankiaceae bacterium]|jgi:beta-lactamase superfamily II metal-dependent hydrolase|nr:MBL fold metallo-hydrolase [Frankiaceae bacterium]
MAFAAYPAPFVFDAPDGRRVQQLIFGDYVRVGSERRGQWVQVDQARNSSGWMREQDLQDDRILEIGFVDVGQGDACFVVAPDDRRLLIDAGKSDNLARFLSWRFNLRRNPERVIHIDDAVITHPDADHYEGFRPLFESPQFTFGRVHHNGIVERAPRPLLGPTAKIDGVTYLTDVVTSRTKLQRLVRDPAAVGAKRYPVMLRDGLATGRIGDVSMLSAADRQMPGFNEGPLKIEVLAPVTERKQSRLLLRRLGDDGVTKNGHSVVLMLSIGNVRVLLGGDLNHPAQEYLLEHYGAAAPSVFGADVAKSCHHGSSHFSTDFLRAVNAAATIVSSGDDEPYSHPRPDALGALGKYGRGDRPLIFSTELARSAREFTKRPEALRAAGAPPEAVERAIAVYGMVNVRTRREVRRPRPEARTARRARCGVGRAPAGTSTGRHPDVRRRLNRPYAPWA